MAATQFVAVNWNPGAVMDEDTLDQMNNNINYLRDQSVNGKYQALGGGLVDIRIKLLCGRAIITPRRTDTATVRCSFASMFTPNSTPVVTTSIVSPGQIKIFHKISGIGRLHPNHQGFDCSVNIYASGKSDKIVKPLYVNWIAMGY